MRELILGTAGHIDHGKTSLIQVITGINTDRLKEEKARGITIELGFASITLPSGRQLGIVDVPGHEKFIKHMVAGATGIDIVVMVIAADEGVMPQTKEHMEICSLLNIKHGLIALTKTDLVEKEWIELVIEDIKNFTKSTFMEKTKIIPISTVTGSGIDDFITTLDNLCKKIPKISTSNFFRLPIDRIFTIKGFGTVVTGTLISGKISIGETVMIYPNKIQSKIRGIQVHNKNVTIAEKGMRTAINLQNLNKATTSRGNVIANNNTLIPSYMIDVEFHYLKSNKKKLKNKTTIKLHTGTSESIGNIIILNRKNLYPGESSLAQVRLKNPLTLIKDDRFIIRNCSPIQTIGGGRILNPIPKKHKQFSKKEFEELNKLVDCTKDKIVDYHLKNAGYLGISFRSLLIMINADSEILNSIIAKKIKKKTIIKIDKNHRYVHCSIFEKIKTNILDTLKLYHNKYPFKIGMPKEELKSKFSTNKKAEIFQIAFQEMIQNNEITLDKNLAKLNDHTLSIEKDQIKIKNEIIKIFKKNSMTPPYFKEIAKKMDINPKQEKEILNFLINTGLLIKIKTDLYYYNETLNEIEKSLVEFLKKNDKISTAQFKTLTKVSRKYIIPLIEYFDDTKITMRIGNTRILRKQHKKQ